MAETSRRPDDLARLIAKLQRRVSDLERRTSRRGHDHLITTLYYTSSGSFIKANYPWLRAVRVRAVGGGGGCGGVAATGAGVCSAASGGSGGGYAESFVPASSLGSSVTVTVGVGGSAGGNGATAGGNGGSSSFGGHVVAPGGVGGAADGVASSSDNMGSGRQGGIGGTGALTIEGGNSGGFVRLPSLDTAQGGFGGGSMLASLARPSVNGGPAFSGRLYGGGAAGPSNRSQSLIQSGAAGADGIVIVELYA